MAAQAEDYAPTSTEQGKAADKESVTPAAIMVTGGSLRSDAYSGGSSALRDSDLTAAEEGNKQREPVLYDHEWQHAVYEGRRLPSDYRYHQCLTSCFKIGLVCGRRQLYKLAAKCRSTAVPSAVMLCQKAICRRKCVVLNANADAYAFAVNLASDLNLLNPLLHDQCLLHDPPLLLLHIAAIAQH